MNLTKTELAKMCGVSVQAVTKAIEKSHLVASGTGRELRIDTENAVNRPWIGNKAPELYIKNAGSNQRISRKNLPKLPRQNSDSDDSDDDPDESRPLTEDEKIDIDSLTDAECRSQLKLIYMGSPKDAKTVQEFRKVKAEAEIKEVQAAETRINSFSRGVLKLFVALYAELYGALSTVPANIVDRIYDIPLNDPQKQNGGRESMISSIRESIVREIRASYEKFELLTAKFPVIECDSSDVEDDG